MAGFVESLYLSLLSEWKSDPFEAFLLCLSYSCLVFGDMISVNNCIDGRAIISASTEK